MRVSLKPKPSLVLYVQDARHLAGDSINGMATSPPPCPTLAGIRFYAMAPLHPPPPSCLTACPSTPTVDGHSPGFNRFF